MVEKDRLIDFDNDFTEEEEAVFQATPQNTITARVGVTALLELEEQVVKKYRGGMSVVQIAKDYDISFGKIYDILARHGVPLRNGRSKRSKSYKRLKSMTRKEKETLINDYINGMSLKEIFKKYNINKHGVYTLLNEANVPLKQDRKLHNEKEWQSEVEPKHGQRTIFDFIDEAEEDKEVEAKTETEAETDTKSVKIEKKDGTLHIELTKHVFQDVDTVKVSFATERVKG